MQYLDGIYNKMFVSNLDISHMITQAFKVNL